MGTERSVPNGKDLALEARLAACEEAEATHAALEARLSVMRSLLADAGTRLDAHEGTVEALRERAGELAVVEEEASTRVALLREGNAACERRLALTKTLIEESGRKIETLRTRGGMAEEMHREQTIQLGVLGEV